MQIQPAQADRALPGHEEEDQPESDGDDRRRGEEGGEFEGHDEDGGAGQRQDRRDDRQSGRVQEGGVAADVDESECRFRRHLRRLAARQFRETRAAGGEAG